MTDYKPHEPEVPPQAKDYKPNTNAEELPGILELAEQNQNIFNELVSMGYRRIREIEHDIIDRKLFSPDLPIMPYICEKHNISIDQYIIISHKVQDHACSKVIYEKLTENQDGQ
jgi:hypothetical protein